jgi:hypothetical protein
MNNTLHELKARLKAKLDNDGRFSDGYTKIIIDYLTEIINDISKRGNNK